jgi:hypothetical protein
MFHHNKLAKDIHHECSECLWNREGKCPVGSCDCREVRLYKRTDWTPNNEWIEERLRQIEAELTTLRLEMSTRPADTRLRIPKLVYD